MEFALTPSFKILTGSTGWICEFHDAHRQHLIYELVCLLLGHDFENQHDQIISYILAQPYD